MTGLLFLLTSAASAAPASLVQLWDFEADDGAFLSEGDLPQWEWGEPGVGPSAAHSGTRLWGTELDGEYLRENRISLTLAPLDLAGVSDPVLVFWSWLDLASGDTATIETFDGVEWTVAAPVYGYPSADGFPGNPRTWEPLYFDLSELDDASKVRLVLESDAGRALGWYVDDVSIWSGDAVPPNVALDLAPEEWSRFDQGPTFELSAVDDQQVQQVSLLWSTQDGPSQRSDFTATGSDRFALTLPAQVPGTITWSIEASDGQNVSSWPADGPGTTRVYLPAPDDLVGPTERTWGTEVPLTWTAPQTGEALVGYRVYLDEQPLLDTVFPFATAPAAGPVDSYRVSGLFRTSLGDLEGDLCEAVQVEVAVPRLEAIEPSTAWQGEQLRLVLTGSSLLLDSASLEAADLYLGEGVELVEVDVQHVDRAVFTVQIGAQAPVGPRDAWLDIRGVEVFRAEALEIQDGADRPAVLALSPQAVAQGDSETVLITLNSPPAALPTVSFGEGVIIGEVRLDGSTVEVDLSVSNAAAVGSRRVTVDDGLRVLELDDGFRVWATEISVGRCQAAPSSAGWALLPLLALFRRRRR